MTALARSKHINEAIIKVEIVSSENVCFKGFFPMTFLIVPIFVLFQKFGAKCFLAGDHPPKNTPQPLFIDKISAELKIIASN